MVKQVALFLSQSFPISRPNDLKRLVSAMPSPDSFEIALQVDAVPSSSLLRSRFLLHRDHLVEAKAVVLALDGVAALLRLLKRVNRRYQDLVSGRVNPDGSIPGANDGVPPAAAASDEDSLGADEASDNERKVRGATLWDAVGSKGMAWEKFLARLNHSFLLFSEAFFACRRPLLAADGSLWKETRQPSSRRPMTPMAAVGRRMPCWLIATCLG